MTLLFECAKFAPSDGATFNELRGLISRRSLMAIEGKLDLEITYCVP